MASSGPPVLHKLRLLDTSSADFDDQLCNVLYGEEYVKCLSSLEGGDAAWLVDYLDKVRHCAALSYLPLSLRAESRPS